MANKTFNVKILRYIGEYHDDFDRVIMQDMTGWEEVSEADYNKLVKWVNIKNRDSTYSSDEKYLLVRKEDYDFKACISEYLDTIQAEEVKAAEKKRRREEAKKLREARANKLKESEEKALLAQLKSKYESK